MRKFSAIFFLGAYLLLCSYTLFEKRIGTSTCYEEGVSAVHLSNGNYLVSGAYNCSGRSSDWESYLLYIDSEGDTIWTKKNLELNGIVKKTSDGNLIFAGADQAGFVGDTIKIFKATLLGNILWQTTLFYPICKNQPTDIIETGDGGFLVTGIFANNSCSNPLYDSFILKLDRNGKSDWDQIFSGPGNDQLFSVKEMPNGDAVAFGWTNSKTQSNDADYVLIKTDANGNIKWHKTFGDTKNNFGYGMDITEANGFILTGYDDSTQIIKLDADGNFIWKKTYGQVCGGRYFKVRLSNDGGYVFLGSENIAGSCTSYLIKTDFSGNIFWKKTFSGKLRDFEEDEDGVYLLTGYQGYLPDIYIMKFDSTSLDIPTQSGQEIFPGKKNLTIYPTPANDRLFISFGRTEQTSLKVEIFDILGNVVSVQNKSYTDRLCIEKGNLVPGVYSFRIMAEGKVYSGKFLFQ